MTIEPFFITGLIIVFVCFGLIVISIVVLYIRSSRALSALNTEFILYKRDQESQAREALLVATKKAQEIIASTQMFSDETKKWVMDAVNKSIASGSSTYMQIINDLGQKSVKDLLTYSDTLKKSIEVQTHEITSGFISQLQSEEKVFHSTLEKDEQQIIEDIAKRAELMLPQIIKDASGRALTQEESEVLVLSSLEKIKKQHGF